MSQITSLEVYYKEPNRKRLLADVWFSIPVDSLLKNPNGSITGTFPISSNGPIGSENDVIMNFTEIEDPGGPSTNKVPVNRKAFITLNKPFTATHKTIVILKKADGTEEGRKSQTGDDYIEDPDKEYGEAQ